MDSVQDAVQKHKELFWHVLIVLLSLECTLSYSQGDVFLVMDALKLTRMDSVKNAEKVIIKLIICASHVIQVALLVQIHQTV